MNMEQYLKLQATNDNYSDELSVLPLGSVKKPLDTQVVGQARINGHKQQHIDELVADMELRPQIVPITVERDGEEFIAIDGNHRIEALLALTRMYPESAKFKKVKAYVTSFKSDAERLKYQSRANAGHMPALTNSAADIASQIRNLQSVKDPDVPMPPEVFEQQGKYKKDLRVYIEREYRPLVHVKNAAIKNLCSKLKNDKLRNITKPDLDDMFASWNNLGWDGKDDNKEGVDGWKVYTAAKAGGKFPSKSIMCYTLKSKSSAQPGSVNNAVVIWDNNTQTKDGKRIDDYRRSVVESMNELNASHLLKRGKKLVDKIFIAPQKLSKHCLEEGFFEVDVDRKNKFITKTIPRDGWSHMSLKEEK